jgi:GR25 family glycosyltransferase involved in LPS biosynthesis
MDILIGLLIIYLVFVILNTFFIHNIEKFEEITNDINKIYYINLDRRPDRNQHFLEECNKCNFNMNNVIRVKGIDGLTHNFSEDELNMFKNADFNHTDAKTKIMGNQLSHYYILQDMIKNNYDYIIIFQDDVILRDDFNDQINKLLKNIPEDAEIINFGFHKTANLKNFEALNINDPIESQVQSKKDINDYVCILSDNVNPCSLAYLVTLKGANNLVNHFNNIGFLRATDWNYADYLVSKNINYATKTVLCTGNNKFESDIFK